MAARLVQRYCRQLFGASISAPLTAPTSVLVPACKTVIARKPQAALASLHISSLSRQTDKLSFEVQQVDSCPKDKDINELIATASDPEDLFHIVTYHSLNEKQASSVIIQLSRIMKVKTLEKKNVLKDLRFKQALSIVNSKLSQLWNGILLPLLKSLCSLGMERNTRELRLLKQEIHWRLKRLNIGQVANLAKFLAVNRKTEDEYKLLSECVRQLELRWTEIENPAFVATLMMKIGHLSGILMDHLEDKALEVAEKFSAADIQKVALALAVQNRRSVPLLQAISYQLVQKEFVLSTDILVDLIYVYGKLNFHQFQVLQKLASQLQGRLSEMPPRDIGRCLRSFSYLKWLNLLIFENFTEYFLDNADSFPAFVLYNYVMTFAHLNFQPSKAERFYELVHEKIGDHLGTIDPHMQLDVVWSLCVLQQVKTPYLVKMLSPQFCNQFLADNQSTKGRGYLLRLWHINATAMLESPDYPGPFLPPEALNETWWPEQRKISPGSQCLQEVLDQLVKDNDHKRYNVQTIYGWPLAAEMVLNSDGEPLPVKDFAAPHMFHPGSTQPLPPDAKRVAFLVWEFPNYVSRSKDLLGRFVMARRHLQAAGFLVVDVPYYEFMDLSTGPQKTAYLKSKLSKVLAEEMAK
uniref:FAST kinase domain-containing protein 4 n=1 Tax=Pelusios castaneus TaxID=367368 RepID=A0A8C8SVJ4_9SAUR